MKTSDCTLQLIDADSLSALPEEDYHEFTYTKKYIHELIKQGLPYFCGNLNAEIFALKVNRHLLPVVIVSGNYSNSYVCSPYGHYISYAQESLQKLIPNPLLRNTVKSLIGVGGMFGRFSRMNFVIYVNHWLFSTDLYPYEITADELSAITKFFEERYPHHAVAFRSLNAKTNAPLILEMKNQGFCMIASRQVFITDLAAQSTIFSTRILKSDLKLMRETPYHIFDPEILSTAECEEILKLYHLLYIDEHSLLNPQFNIRFVEHLNKQGVMRFKLIKNEGKIIGVAGYLTRHGVLLSPLFGYDKKAENQAEIYRLLSTSLLLEAKERGLIFHQSSGASFFKSIRRAKAEPEYMALHIQHLPLRQRLFWLNFSKIMNFFAPKFMQKY